jgi:hypothetical protein
MAPQTQDGLLSPRPRPPGISWVGIAAAVAIGIGGFYIGDAVALRYLEPRPTPRLYSHEVATMEELPKLQSRAETVKDSIDNTRKRINSESLGIAVDTATLGKTPKNGQAIKDRIEIRKSVFAELEAQMNALLKIQQEADKQVLEAQDRVDRKVRDRLRVIRWYDRSIRALYVLLATLAIFLITLPVHHWRYFSNNPWVILAGSILVAITLGISSAVGLPGVILVLVIGMVVAAGRPMGQQ